MFRIPFQWSHTRRRFATFVNVQDRAGVSETRIRKVKVMVDPKQFVVRGFEVRKFQTGSVIHALVDDDDKDVVRKTVMVRHASDFVCLCHSVCAVFGEGRPSLAEFLWRSFPERLLSRSLHCGACGWQVRERRGRTRLFLASAKKREKNQ